MGVYTLIGIVGKDSDKHYYIGLMIAVKFRNKFNYFVGAAETDAVGVADVVVEFIGGIGVGKTRGVSSILFKTLQSMLI